MSIQVGYLPVPTWNRLGVNYAEVMDDLTLNTSVETHFEVLPEGVAHRTLSSEEAAQWLSANAPSEPPEFLMAGKAPIYHPQDFGTGLGQQFDTLLRGAGTGAQLLEAAPGVKVQEPILWNIDYPDQSRSMQEQLIHVGAGAQMTVIVSCRSVRFAEGLAGISTRIVLENGASLLLVKTQLMGNGFVFLDDTGAALREDASLSVIQVELGGGKVFAGMQPELVGDRARCDAKVYYLGMQERQIDINYNVVQRGRRTQVNLKFDGVLDGHSQKTLRDTIDFRHGSGGSKGREDENVLVLSDGIVNKSMPNILCEEEDVEGGHGATIGQLDEAMLFYLASRGISRSEAVQLMVRARLAAVVSGIPDARLRSELLNEVEEVFWE